MKLTSDKLRLIVLLLLASMVFSECTLLGLKKKKRKVVAATTTTPAAPVVVPKPDEPKPYAEIVPATAKSSAGFFTVHLVAGRYLFELPDSILSRDLFSVNRIVRSAADYRMPISFGALCSYGGDWMGQNLFHFEKIAGNKIVLKMISVTEKAGDSTQNGVSRSLLKNNLQPIYATFPVKAVNQSKHSVVIDMTDYLGTANGIFGSQPLMAGLMPSGPVAADRSFIKEIKAFPANIEIKNVRTMTAGLNTITFEFNNSIILHLTTVPRG